MLYFSFSLLPMDLSRLKKVFAGVSAAAISLTQVGTALAVYTDVPAGVWYESAVQTFMDAGYLDSTKTEFRGGDSANRAEFVKLVVELNGGILSTPPAVPSFDDVPASAWYYGYFEEAGKEGWVKGDGDCYGSTPCMARPGANINRAEASALIVRSFGLPSLGLSAQFVDNPSGQWYTDVIQTAADHCVLQGDDGTGRVRPGDNMNRAEMVVMLDRVDQGMTYGVDCGGDMGMSTPLITDVYPTSATTLEVEFNVGLDPVTAEDPATYSVVCDGSDMAVDSAVMLDDMLVELTLGEAMDPSADCSVAVDGMWTADGEEFSDLLDFAGYTAVPVGDGLLEVTLSASNPVTDTVPKGAVGVVMLSVDLTASCDDSVIIEDLTVLHEGFGDETDIDGIYAAIDGARVSRKRTIDSEDQTAELRFSSPLVIDPCETVTVDIVGDFTSSAATASEHNLVVELASDVVSNAREVSGSFPVRGNTFRVAAVTSGTVEVTYRSVTPNEVEVGDTGVVVGKFEIESDSVEDQTFYSMTLEQNGSASDGDFVNIAIRRTDGTVLTNTVASTVGDFVTLVFDPPFTVLEGDKITLEVIADIVGGAGDNISLEFEESSDIFAVGSLYGYGVNGQLYGSQVTINTSPSAASVTIDAGEFTIGIDGPSSQDYTRDDNDAVLANVEFSTGGEAIDVKNMFVAVKAETSSGAALDGTTNISQVLEDVEMRNVVTGRTIDGVRLTTSGTFGNKGTTTGVNTSCSTVNGPSACTFQIYRFDDFIVRGEEEWELRVDFIDNGATSHPKSGDEFQVFICTAPTNVLNTNGALVTNTTTCDFDNVITGSTAYQIEVEGLSTGDKVGDVRPGTLISGQTHRIENASLTVQARSIADDTTVKNADGIRLFRFEATAGDAEDVLFTKAVFSTSASVGNLTGTGSANNMESYTLWVDDDGDGEVNEILQSGVSAQNGKISFNELEGGGFVIPAGDPVLFEVRGDVSTSPTNNIFEMSFDTASTFIEAEELDDGSNLSGISFNGTVLNSATSVDIVVTDDGAAPRYTIANQGDLFVEFDSTVLEPRQLLGGKVAEPVLRLRMEAQYEDIDVTDLQITGSGMNAKSVEKLNLYFDGASTPFATATQNECAGDTVPTGNGAGGSGITFCASLNNLIVGVNEEVVVEVRPDIKTDVEGGLSSGTLLSFFLGSGQYLTETRGSIRADGVQSSGDLRQNDADGTAEGEIYIHPQNPGPSQANVGLESDNNHVVMSKITSITDAAGGGGAITPGTTSLGKFKFTAATNVNSLAQVNSVVMSGLILTVNATRVDLAANGFSLYKEPSTSTSVTCTPVTTGGTAISSSASGTFFVICQGLNAAGVNIGTINSGQSATYTLRGNVTDPNTSTSGGNSTLQVSLQDFDDITDTTFAYNGSHIQWIDDDSNAATDTTFLWVEYPTDEVKSATYNG